MMSLALSQATEQIDFILRFDSNESNSTNISSVSCHGNQFNSNETKPFQGEMLPLTIIHHNTQTSKKRLNQTKRERERDLTGQKREGIGWQRLGEQRSKGGDVSLRDGKQPLPLIKD